jgi:hypothetical protein
MSPRQLRKLLEEFGDVGDISIHAGEGLVYGLAEMSREDAYEVIEAVDEAEWNSQRRRGPGAKFSAELADRSAGPWLSHEWVPSAIRWKRKTETEDSDFSRAEPRRPVAIGER